jgi:hypothetical protein
MKIFFAIFMLAFSTNMHAQDFCKQIKKDVSEDKVVYDYASPFDPVDPPPVRATRSYSTIAEFGYDNFIAIFQTPCPLDSVYNKGDDGSQVEKEEYKLVVVFDDGAKFTDDAIKITHDFTEDRSQALRVVYLTFTPENMKDFLSKKIARFSLAGHEQNIPADVANAFMHYVACLKSVK